MERKRKPTPPQARKFPLMGWWALKDSNFRPTVYETAALTICAKSPCAERTEKTMKSHALHEGELPSVRAVNRLSDLYCLQFGGIMDSWQSVIESNNHVGSQSPVFYL